MLPNINFSSWWWKLYTGVVWATFLFSILNFQSDLARFDGVNAVIFVVLSVWFLALVIFVTERTFNHKFIPLRIWRIVFIIEILTMPLQIVYSRKIALILIEGPVNQVEVLFSDVFAVAMIAIYLYALYSYSFRGEHIRTQ